jgi:Cellulose biosynthesis protein BcsS
VRVLSEALRSLTRAALCAAALTCVATPPVKAADEPGKRPNDLRTVLFGSLDAGHSTFGTLGVKRTLHGPLDRSGTVGMASLGYGGTRERARFETDDGRLIRHALQGSTLLGYQWVGDGLVVAALAGPEIEGEQLSDHFTPRVTRPHFGARLHGEIWAHPTQNTLLTGNAIVGTARTPHLWGRASAGYRLWGDVFLGPEASVYSTDTYREWRFGAHVTGVFLGGVSLRLSAGWRGEEDTRDRGAYAGISAHIKM